MDTTRQYVHSLGAVATNKLIRRACLSVCIILALSEHFLATIKYARLDFDSPDTLMLWYGFKQYGFTFLRNFYYTQDNWLLSLLPIHALLFMFFPFNSWLVVLFGFALWGLSAGLCGLIAYRLRAKKAMFLAPILLLCASQFVYDKAYLVYFITHNISNFWGLVCLFFAILWIQRAYKLDLAVVFGSAVIAGLSDPWFLPAYCLPIIVASILLWKISHNDQIRTRAFNLFAVIAFSYVAIASKFFGTFYFFPQLFYKFSFAQLSHLLLILAKNLGFFFNFFPIYNSWASIISLIILFGLVIFVGVDFRRRQLAIQPESILFFLTGLFSFVMLPLSFILGAHLKAFEARYFINFFVVGILGLSIGLDYLWLYLSKWTKKIIGVLILLYATSAWSTQISLWSQMPHLPVSGEEGVLNFLIKNQLTYGYSDFLSATLLTGLSQDAIRVRPIDFSPVTGDINGLRLCQSSLLWASAKDIPLHQNNFFVYLRNSEPANPVQKDALIAQLGRPSQILKYEKNLILVWDKPYSSCSTLLPFRANCSYLNYP